MELDNRGSTRFCCWVQLSIGPTAWHGIRPTMPEKKCRFAILLLPCFLKGCGPQDGTNTTSVVAPMAVEKAFLEQALADIVAKNDTCLTGKIEPLAQGLNYWPYTLSFGDGKLTYAGDPRYDQALKAWDEVKPLHSNSIQMPDQAGRQGFRVVEDARSDASCLEVRTLHLPRFRDDFAFVMTAVHWKSTVHSRVDVQVLRLQRDRWVVVGSGGTDSRPVI